MSLVTTRELEARNAVQAFFDKYPLQTTSDVVTDGDFFMGWLWLKGYKLVKKDNF